MKTTATKPTLFYVVAANKTVNPTEPHYCLQRCTVVRYFTKKIDVKPTKRGFLPKQTVVETRCARVQIVKGAVAETPSNLLFEEKIPAYEKMFELWDAWLVKKKADLAEAIKVLREGLDDSRAARRRQRQEYLRMVRTRRLKDIESKVISGIDVQDTKVPLYGNGKPVIRRKNRKFINS